MGKIVKFVGAAIALLVIAGVGACAIMSKSLPSGEAGESAEALTAKMQQAVGMEAWEREVGAVTWNFVGRNTHLWDKERDFARVQFKNGSVALVDLRNQKGVAFDKDGEAVDGSKRDDLVASGWAAWVNDAFWLNPMAKATDPGTTRQVITLDDGRKGVLVSYTGGGLTPGDSYLWILADDGTPEAVRMWVSNIPIKGVEFSWEDWKTLPGGAKVAAKHDGPVNIEITEIKGARTLAELTGGEEDPFAALVAAQTRGDSPAEQPEQPSSQPGSQPGAESQPAP